MRMPLHSSSTGVWGNVWARITADDAKISCGRSRFCVPRGCCSRAKSEGGALRAKCTAAAAEAEAAFLQHRGVGKHLGG